jgi:beta-glucosidase-like glycosyl hydrolase
MALATARAPRALRALRSSLCGSALLLAACSGSDSAVDQEDSAIFSGTPEPEIGQFFMVEHYGVVAGGYADVHDDIRRKNLGAVILWNPTSASGEVARAMVASYASTAHAAQHDELFVAADQEEHGTQRFKSAEGFTDLATGAQLGAAVGASGARVCELHARITAREMGQAGMNMALGTVSDIFTRTSGTPGMFRTRAIAADPAVVASCITAMTKGYAEEGHVVFITKHFPGLGNASGNTDVDASVHTESVTKPAMELELGPYRAATASVNTGDSGWPLFGAMVSHASYPILDGTGSPATLSPVIVSSLLRGASDTELSLGGVDGDHQPVTFKGMSLRGVTVSDAFWTWGAMQGLAPINKRRLMAQSFLAGMDILMIAKADFAGAWDYFQALYANQLPSTEQAALVRATHLPDWGSVHAKFKDRVDESAKRIRAVKKAVGPSASFAGTGAANATSGDLVAEYQQLLH